MKKFFAFFFFSFFVNCIIAQDIIVKKDFQEEKIKLVEVSTKWIKYKRYSYLDGPIFQCSVSNLVCIIYENGEVDVFNKKKYSLYIKKNKVQGKKDSVDGYRSGMHLQNIDSLPFVKLPKNYFTISLSGGTSGNTMMPSYGSILSESVNFDDDSRPVVLHPDSLRITPFLGGTFGFGYEYQGVRGFWFSVGVEGQILSGGLHYKDNVHRIENVSDGDKLPESADVEYTVRYWKERQTNVYVTMPIMLGYKHESGMYFGAGARLGFSLKNKIRGGYVYEDCNMYYGDRMPIMGIYKFLALDNVLSHDANFVSLPQVNPMFEIGWQGLDRELGRKSRMRFKFALVGEFSVMTTYKTGINSAEQLFDYNSLEGFMPGNLTDFFITVHSFYSTIPIGLSGSVFDGLKGQGKFVNFAKPTSLHSWFVGFKFSILLGRFD